MKQLLLISLFFFTGLPMYAQSKMLAPKAGGNGEERSASIPRAFVTISNNHFTFIKDSLNHLSAVAHGYDDTRLECSNCQIIQEESILDYLVYTPDRGECTITLFGMNSTTKKEIILGKFIFQIADSVYHDIYLDDVLSGNAITSKVKTIDCKNRAYWNWEENMELLTWKINYKNSEIKGTGNELTKEARKLIGDIPPGESLIVTVQAKSNFQKPFVTSGVFLKK